MDIQTKRVYEPADAGDGLRVLVDRVWPRGLSKAQVQAGLWMKEIAPSTDLRKWFDHDPLKWHEFKRRYFLELDANQAAVEQLRQLAARQRLTLLFSARDSQHIQAVALKEYLLAREG